MPLRCENCERDIAFDEKSYDTEDGYTLCAGCQGELEAELFEPSGE